MSTIAPGAHIELRDAVWRVIRVDQSSTGQQAWTCVGVSEIVRDMPALFLEEMEDKRPRVLDPRTTVLVRDTSSQHRAGLLTIEAHLRDVPAPRDGLHVGHMAAMDALDYQLDPAWMALQAPRARILIADSVGLGKTLEAGILLSELIQRGQGRRILVAVTKAMLAQFQKEMWCRFSVPLVRMDSVGLQRLRSRLPSHHNPFYAFDRVIVSIDTLKQDNAFRAHLEAARWDVVVIDEAHNVAVRGKGAQRAQLARMLARRTDHLLLLSATPHDGSPRSFASLMDLLDPTAIADPKNYTAKDIHGLFVRRFRRQVADQLNLRIPERQVLQVTARATPQEEAAFAALTALDLVATDKGKVAAGALFKAGLTKSLLSSPAACLQTLTRRLETLRRRLKEQPTRQDVAHDIAQLESLEPKVQAIPQAHIAKLDTFARLVKGWKWKGSAADRLVVFTERRPTLTMLEEQLPARLGLKPEQVATLDGDMSDTDLMRIVEDFGSGRSKVRLLLATDVASEGLNLHYQCFRLVHWDLPWSLMVFQQRNGRVDRYGQSRKPLIAYLLLESADPGVEADQRIVKILSEKDTRAQKNLDGPSVFDHVLSVEHQEQIVATSIAARQSEEQFAQTIAPDDDPFAALLAQASQPTHTVAPRLGLPSVFESPYEHLAATLQHLDVPHEARRQDRILVLTAPDDLVRRYRRLPDEVAPSSSLELMLTDDAERMQKALEDKRREEQTWPDHQYLWPLHPVLDWAADRVRGAFGRHAAPVLLRDMPDEAAFVVSGVWPNRRAQPLVHAWMVVLFPGPRVVPFETWLARPLGKLPNRERPLDLAPLQALVPQAIDAVMARLQQDKQAFRREMDPKLHAERQRLARLRSKQLSLLDEIKGQAERTDRQARIEGTFREHEQWVADAMTMGSVPFVQLIAAFVPRSA